MKLHPDFERIGQEVEAVVSTAKITVREALANERKRVALDLRRQDEDWRD